MIHGLKEYSDTPTKRVTTASSPKKLNTLAGATAQRLRWKGDVAIIIYQMLKLLIKGQHNEKIPNIQTEKRGAA